MALRDLLVHLKPWETWSSHIDYAIELAAAHQARLTGLIASNQPALLAGFFNQRDPVVMDQLTQLEAAATKLETAFREAASAKGVTVRVQSCHGPGSEIIAWGSLLSDLTVVEQTEPNDELDWDIAEKAALTAGGGVIVVPRGLHPAPPRRIVVGWNGTREAANAVRAALPLIARADSVTLLNGPRRPIYPAVRKGPSLRMEDRLLAANPNVTSKDFAPDEPRAGAALLAEAANADLLVMGAYGRSWLSEFILGGATREVLRTMRVPVLLSH